VGRGEGFLLPLMFLVRSRILWVDMKISKMKDWMQPLENPVGSSYALLEGVWS